MKIALVCPYHYNSQGGVQTHIRYLARAMRKRGHLVSVIAPRGSKGEGVINAGACRRLRFSGTAFEVTGMGWREFLALRRRLKEEHFDLIHFHTIWNPVLPLQVLLASGVPRVATFHDTAPDSTLGKFLAKTVMPVVSAILCGAVLQESIAVSPSPLGHLSALYKGEIHVIPNGVDSEEFRPGGVRPLERYLDGKKNILYLSRLEERKGVFYLLKAYRSLRSGRDDVRLLLAGDGHLREAVEEFVAGLPDVEMLGSVDEETKRRLYATCDVFCAPAVAGESFGIVLLEAMASGKPAVGAANSGFRWVLQGEGAQLLVPPRDHDALADKLSALLDDPEFRGRMGEWGLREATFYDWTRVAESVETVYRQALRRYEAKGAQPYSG